MRRTPRGDWSLEHPWGVVAAITMIGAGVTVPTIARTSGATQWLSIALLALCPVAGFVMWGKPNGIVRRRYVELLRRQDDEPAASETESRR